MLSVTDILQFHFSPTAFQQAAHKAIPVTLVQLNDIRIDKLKKITQEVGAASFNFNGDNLIPIVFRKFKSSIQNSNLSFDRRELRTLSYSLSYSEKNQSSIINSKQETEYAIHLFNTYWRDSFLIGLIDCCLKNWENKQRESFVLVATFIGEKLKTYNGNRTILNAFKANLKYFDLKNGDLILGSELALKNKPIIEATKYLSLPDTWFGYPYFSKVIITYYEKKQNELTNLINDYESALDSHKTTNTAKQLVSKIIIQTNKPEYLVLQNKVKHLAFKYIGDPENKSVWANFENGTDKEAIELKNARIILNEWITRQFINVFFNVCINDDRRKRFWLKYASKISSFKVFGPNRTKAVLRRDERILEYLDARFETVYSTKDVSAFILYIGDYMFIEFSDAGYAFYAYKVNGSFRPSLNIKLNSVDDLRNGNMPMLAYRTGYYINSTSAEGRLSHNDGDLRWEAVFDYWLKNVAKIDV